MPRYDAVESMKSQSYVKSEGIYQEESNNENENRSNTYFSDLNNCHIYFMTFLTNLSIKAS